MGAFKYGHFGLGFNVTPILAAVKFSAYLRTRGEALTVFHRTHTEHDIYGDPIWVETEWTLYGFIQEKGSERIFQIGDLAEHRVKIFFEEWAPIEEGSCEVELHGKRHHILSIIDYPAYRLAEAVSVLS